jgi:ankyrin repeat protein
MHFSIFDTPDLISLSNTEMRGQDGDTPLLRVVKEYLRQVSLLPDDGYLVDATDTLIEQLDILVHKGANVNAQDRHFRTALILLASSKHSMKVIRFLIEAGASTLLMSGAGWDAVDDAIHYGNIEIAEYLRRAKTEECRKRSKMVAPIPEKKRWSTFWKYF